MEMMDQARGKAINDAIRSKGVKQPCGRCGSKEFELQGETVIPLQHGRTVTNDGIDGMGVRAAVLVCKGCGHIDLHSSVALGIAPQS